MLISWKYTDDSGLGPEEELLGMNFLFKKVERMQLERIEQAYFAIVPYEYILDPSQGTRRERVKVMQ